MEYLVGVATLVAIYAIAAVALTLAFGLGGIFVVTQGAFLGIGAYTAGVLVRTLPFGFWLALVVGAVIAAALGFAIAQTTIRIRGEAFIVTSIAVQVVIVDVFYNWRNLTGGAYGLSGLPDVLPNRTLFLLLTVIILGGVMVYARRIARSGVGRALRAIRDDELAASMTGKDVVRLRVYIYMVSCSLAAVAGGLLAAFTRYVHPTNFTLQESILLISMIIAGGLGSIHGAVLGALLVVGLPELLRFLPITANYVIEVRTLVYGLGLVLIPFFRPKGLFPDTYAIRDRCAPPEPQTGAAAAGGNRAS